MIPLWSVVGIALGAYLVLATIVGRYLVYNDIRSRESPDPVVLRALYVEDVTFTSHDGLSLQGWMVEDQQTPNRGTIFVLHGWHRDRNRVINHIRLLAEEGFRVITYDQRAHGTSDTGLISFGPLEGADLIQVLEQCRKTILGPKEPLGVLAQSMGTAAVISAQARVPDKLFSCMVLEGVAKNSFDAGKYMLERKLGRSLGNFVGYAIFTLGSALASRGRFRHFSSLEKVHSLEGVPKLFIRGDKDHMVSEHSATALIEASPEPKFVWRNKNGGHTNNLSASPGEYREVVLEFLRSNVEPVSDNG